LVLLVVLGVFAPICRHEFIAWDDDRTIQHNPRIQNPSLENAAYYWRHQHLGLYIPVTYGVWSLVATVARIPGDGAESGALDPRFFHAASVALHALGALLVFAILRKLTARTWASAAGALLFALHPIQVEAVAWASGLKDVLGGAFTLFAIWLYLLAVAPDQTGKRRSSRSALHYALALVAMLLGMLSKPGAVVTPLLIVILDLLILRRHWRATAASAASFFVLTIPCVVWTKICQPATNLLHTPLWARPLVAADALTFYVTNLVWPVHLGLDYGRTPPMVLQGPGAWVSLVLIGSLITGAIMCRRHPLTRVTSASGLLFAAALMPVLGLTPFAFQTVSTVTDHYLYVAMLGPALLLAWIMVELGKLPKSETTSVRYGSPVTIAFLCVLAFAARAQASHWEDSRSLLCHTLEVNPRSWAACTNLASLDYDEARTLQAIAAVCEMNGRKDEAATARDESEQRLREAESLLTRSLEIFPDNIAARHTRGVLRMYFHHPAQAAADFAQAVALRDRLAPDDRPGFYQDDDLLGQALLDAGRPAEAATAFRRALALRPAPPQAAEHLRIATLREQQLGDIRH
jgi:hypothetical protein